MKHFQSARSAGTPYVEIGGRRIGDGEPCWVIAEIGINHNGDVDLAKQLIDAARPPAATR